MPYAFEVQSTELLPDHLGIQISPNSPLGENESSIRSVDGAKILKDIEKSYDKGKNLLQESAKVERTLTGFFLTGRDMASTTLHHDIFGWVDKGQIFLTKEGLHPKTLVHEYTHLWAKAMQMSNPEGWQSVVNTLKEKSPLWDLVQKNPIYKSLLTNDDKITSEVLARLTEFSIYQKVENLANISILSGGSEDLYELLEEERNAVESMWNWTGKNLFKDIHFNNINEIQDRVFYDLYSGKNLGVTLNVSDIEYRLKNTNMEYAPSPLDLSSVELTPIEKELVQMVAERSHQAWYNARRLEGVTFEDNPLMEPWSDLTAEERVSSLDSAEQAVKAAKAKFGTLDEFASGRAELNPAAVVDAIAENAHEVWARQRMDAGWTYGEVRDNDAKKHPMLIPYSEVPEKEKEYDKDYGRHVVSSLQTLSRRHYTIAEKDAYHMEDGRLVGQKGDEILTGIKDIRRSESTGLLVATYEDPSRSPGDMWYALVEPETGAVVNEARLSPLDQSFDAGDIVIRPYTYRYPHHFSLTDENRLLVYDKNTGKHSTIHAASGTRIQINGETYFKITNDSNQKVQLVSPNGEFVLPEGFHEPISILRVGEKPYVLTSRMGMNYLLDIEKGVPVEKSMNMNTDQYGQFSMTLTGAKVPGMVLGEKPFYMTEKNISGSRHPIVHGDGVFNIITDEGRPFFSKDVSIQEAFGKELPDGIAKNDGSLGIHPMREIELNGKKYYIIYIDDDVKESVNIFSEDGKKVFPESLVSLRTISKEPHKDTVGLFTRITICGRDYLQTRHDFGQSPSGTDRFRFEAFDPETGELYMKSRTCILPDSLVPGAVRIPLCDKEGMWQGIDLVVSDKGDITFYKREYGKDYWLVSTPEKFRPSDAMADVSIKDGYIIMQNPETGNLSIWSQDGKKCLVDHEKGQIVERRRFPIVGAKETYIRLNGIEIPLKRLVENRKAPKLAVADGKSERRKDISDQGSSTSIGNQTEIPVGFIKAVADDELRQDRNRPADPSRSPEKVYDSILYPDENEALGAIGTVGHAVRDENGDKVVVGIRYDEGTGKTTCKREKVDDIKKKFGVDDAEDKRNVIIPVKVGDQIHELKVPKSLAEDLARGKSVTVSEIRINYDPFLGACALTKDYQKVHYYELSNSEKMKEARQQKTQAAKQSLSSPEPKKASGGKKK